MENPDDKSKGKIIGLDSDNKKNKYFKNNFKKNGAPNKHLSDYELNTLSYKEALKGDKRNLFEIYLSKIKRENIIIFTFLVCDDYNLFSLKLSRFLFLMASDMALNAFFFSDDSMHKLFLNYGKYNFVQQIPQLIYSTIFTQLIEVFICFLILIDKYFYQLKENYSKKKLIKSAKIFRLINYKIFSFYLFTYIFFIIYYYIIYSFCAIYKNTQYIFLKDSIISFCISLVYSLILYFISSCLRICAISWKKKFLFSLGELIPFF